MSITADQLADLIRCQERRNRVVRKRKEDAEFLANFELHQNLLLEDAEVKPLDIVVDDYSGAQTYATPSKKTISKYHREIKTGVFVDVYDVIEAFNVRCPALQHLLKKALAAGERGHKDTMTDLRDILASANRAIELEIERGES